MSESEASIEKIPTVGVIVTRDSGKKNDKGQPVYKRETPPVGKPFKFTQDEVTSIIEVDPSALRDPMNESSQTEEQAVQAALQAASQNKGAPNDASLTAATGAKGKGKLKQGSNIETETEDSEDL